MKKKLIPFFIFICLLLSSCARQEGVSAAVFSERFSDSLDEFEAHSGNAFFDEDGYHCLFAGSAENFMLNLYRNESGVVYEASIFSESKEISDRMKDASIKLIKAFTDDEPAENIFETIVRSEKGKYSYFDDQWYSYSLFLSENGYYFSVYDKLLQEYSVPELTLNDLAAHK